jgi:cAMP-dependent protein kinase regulator
MAAPSDRVQSLRDQAHAHAAAGDLDAAVAEYLELLAVAPGDVLARQHAAELLATLGHTARAIEQYQVLVGKYAAEGHLMGAIAVCQLILSLDPSHEETQATLADLFTDRDSPHSPVRSPESTTRAAAPQVDAPAVARVPLFSDLDRDAFVSIVDKLKLRGVSDGETIVEEGAPGHSMYAIARGAVRVIRRAEGRESRVVAEMCEGEFFGEMALLSGAPRFATVVAVGPGQLLELQKADYEALASKHPSLGEVVCRYYKERLLANILRASPMFGLIGDDQRAILPHVLQVDAHPAGRLLLEQGLPGKGFYLLLRGRCDVFHKTADGREMYYPPMHEGDVFGELSLLQNSAVTANVRTGTPCVVLSMDRRWFDELLIRNEAARAALYELAGARFQRTREIVFREELEKRLI